MSRDGEVGEGNLAGEEPVRKCQGEESQEEFPPPDGEAPEHQAEEAQDGQEVEPEKKEDEGSEEYEAGGGTAAKKEGEEEEEEEEEEGEEEDLKGLKEGQSEEDEDDTEDVEAEQDEEKEAVGGVRAPAAGTAVAKNCEEGAGADEVDGPSQEDGGGHRLSTVLAAGKPGRAVCRQKSDPEAPPKKSQKVEPPGGAAHARDGSQKGRKLKAQFSNPEAPPRKICKAADAAPKAEASPQGSKAGLRKIARPLTARGSASQGGFADVELVRLQQDIQTAAARGNFETAAALQDRKKEIEGGRCHVGKVPEEGGVVRDGMDVKNKAKLLIKKAAASRDFNTASAVQEKSTVKGKKTIVKGKKSIVKSKNGRIGAEGVEDEAADGGVDLDDSLSKRSGCVLSVSQVCRGLKRRLQEEAGERAWEGAPGLKTTAGVYAAMVAEYLVAEVMDLAGSAVLENQRSGRTASGPLAIEASHITHVIREDPELNAVWGDSALRELCAAEGPGPAARALQERRQEHALEEWGRKNKEQAAEQERKAQKEKMRRSVISRRRRMGAKKEKIMDSGVYLRVLNVAWSDALAN